MSSTAPPPSSTVRNTVKTVAVIGRQNAGKTSLIMGLTGARMRPVNFPGSSVERTEVRTTIADQTVTLVDLPGVSSTEAMSPDETLTLEYLRDAKNRGAIDLALVVMDATKLSIELRLLRAFRDLGLPLAVVLTRADVVGEDKAHELARGIRELTGYPIVVVDALRGSGLDAVREALLTPPTPATASPSWELPPDSGDAGVQLTTWSDRLDAVLLHPILGLPIALAVVLAAFQLLFVGADPFVGWIESGQGWLTEAVGGLLPDGPIRSFLTDGLIAGIGAVAVFLPQIIMLMAIVAVLEGTGYMARIAFLLDRPLRAVGLSGRSFLPLASSFACAIPGVLATRTIGDDRTRLATLAVAPLMSCSARLPVYVVLIGAFFPASAAGLVLFALYLLGIVVAAVVALILRRGVLRGGEDVLMMELPRYERPSWRSVYHQVTTATWSFVAMAGTVIAAATAIIWVLSYYPHPESVAASFDDARSAAATDQARLADIEYREKAAYLEQSALGQLGKAVQPVFAPAGFDWRTSVGILAAFPAREVILPTLGILYALPEIDAGAHDLASLDGPAEGPDGLRSQLASSKRADGSPSFTPLIALALMVFISLCSQCVSTLGAIKRETRSWSWPLFVFGYMTAVAWVGAVLVYQVGRALGYS